MAGSAGWVWQLKRSVWKRLVGAWYNLLIFRFAGSWFTEETDQRNNLAAIFALLPANPESGTQWLAGLPDHFDQLILSMMVPAHSLGLLQYCLVGDRSVVYCVWHSHIFNYII